MPGQLRRYLMALSCCAGLLAGGLTMSAGATPMADAFTYQGRLTQNGDPVTGPVNLSFQLHAHDEDPDQIGPTLNAFGFEDFDDDGRFTIDLEFGKSVFDGTPLWLEIWVNGAPLSPRQPIMPAPYSVRALTVGTVGSDSLSGSYANEIQLKNPNNQISGTFDGSGAGLTNLNASNLNSGTIGGSLLQGTYGNALTLNNATNVFAGNGAGLTNLSASNLATGTVPSARLNGTYSSALTFSNAGNSFTGNGAGLTNLNASNINGTFSTAQLPSGGDWNLGSLLNIGPGVLAVNPANNRVGIGVTSPNVLFHVNSTTGDHPVRVQVNNDTRFFVSNGGGVTIGGFGNPPENGLRVFGNVAIGVTTPQATLHVAETTVGTGVIMPGMRVFQNTVSPNVVGGHSANEIGTSSGIFNAATIAGGGSASSPNRALGSGSSIGGGIGNTAGGTDATWATVAGGQSNNATGASSTISGGAQNTASGDLTTVSGGLQNVASGIHATIPGGLNNTAAGSYSFAAGRRAKANHQGSFVLADSTNADRVSDATNRFHARFVNGYKLFTNSGGTLGVQALSQATSWSSISDRNVKHNIVPVDSVDVAHRLASIPISWWNYIDDSDNTQHMGPMAQDFHAAFGLGASETHIATLDADGVALAAIQGVYLLVQEKDAEIAALHERIERLEAIVAALIGIEEVVR